MTRSCLLILGACSLETDPDDGGGPPVDVVLHYRDFEFDCWCPVEKALPGDWWDSYSVDGAYADCNDQFFWTASTAEGRCVTTFHHCGDEPFSDPWLDECDLVSGCCELIDDVQPDICPLIYGVPCTSDGSAQTS